MTALAKSLHKVLQLVVFDEDELGRREREIFEARGILVGLGDVPETVTCLALAAEPEPKPLKTAMRRSKQRRMQLIGCRWFAFQIMARLQRSL